MMLHDLIITFGCLPRGVVNFHSIDKSRLAGTPTKKCARKVRSDPRGAASRFLEGYTNES